MFRLPPDTSDLPGVFDGVESLATVKSGPVLPCQSNEAHHLLVVDLAVHCSTEGLLVKGISYTQLTSLGDELFYEGLRNVPLNKDLK